MSCQYPLALRSGFLHVADPASHRLCTTAREFAKRHGITVYTMSTVERNPWSPVRPGQHGYWFLPAVEMRLSFEVNDERHVFTGTSHGPYYYCGYYRVAILGQLTPDEWLSLTYLVRSRVTIFLHAGGTLIFLTVTSASSTRPTMSGASGAAPQIRRTTGHRA